MRLQIIKLFLINFSKSTFKMPEGVEEVPTIGIIYPPPEVRSILYSTTLIKLIKTLIYLILN